MANAWNLFMIFGFLLMYMDMIQFAVAPPGEEDKPTTTTTKKPTKRPTTRPSMSPVMPTQTPITMMHYFLPGSTQSINNSNQFCQDICNSDMASIHSSSQLNDAVQSIQIRPNHIWAPTTLKTDDAYIGLTSTDFPYTPFLWQDSSPFNYGNDTNPGSAPWKHGHPVGYKATCVVLETNTSTWRDVQCDYNTTHRFLCNHCNGRINKYTIISSNHTTYDQANGRCQALYGTSLASIHTDRDREEVTNLLRLTQQKTAWIGLKRMNIMWEDETPLDYGAVEECAVDTDTCNSSCVVAQYVNDSIWKYRTCTNKYAFICYLPSELSVDLNTWTHTTGTDYTALFMLDKQWFNGNDPLWIDLSFIISGDRTIYYGPAIFNQVTASDCYYYWIGLELRASSYVVELYRSDWTDNEILLQRGESIKHQGFPLFITLSIKVTTLTDYNSIFFEIWSNNQQYISYYDDESYDLLNNGHSGYIELWSGDPAIVIHKYLYISGTPKTVSPLRIFGADSECSKILTIAPSKAPSQNSTMKPTEGPTTHPTRIPTVNPTLIPTQTPTEHPTIEPTNNPTTDPTYNPTTEPTYNPTTAPTYNPTTVNPTYNPTTVNPTYNPTIATPSRGVTIVAQHPTIVAFLPAFTGAVMTETAEYNTVNGTRINVTLSIHSPVSEYKLVKAIQIIKDSVINYLTAKQLMDTMDIDVTETDKMITVVFVIGDVLQENDINSKEIEEVIIHNLNDSQSYDVTVKITVITYDTNREKETDKHGLWVVTGTALAVVCTFVCIVVIIIMWFKNRKKQQSSFVKASEHMATPHVALSANDDKNKESNKELADAEVAYEGHYDSDMHMVFTEGIDIIEKEESRKSNTNEGSPALETPDNVINDETNAPQPNIVEEDESEYSHESSTFSVSHKESTDKKEIVTTGGDTVTCQLPKRGRTKGGWL